MQGTWSHKAHIMKSTLVSHAAYANFDDTGIFAALGNLSDICNDVAFRRRCTILCDQIKFLHFPGCRERRKSSAFQAGVSTRVYAHFLKAYTSVFTLVSTDTNVCWYAPCMQLAALTRIWLKTGSLVHETRDPFLRSFTRFRSTLDFGSFNVKGTIDLSRCFRYIGSLIIRWQHRRTSLD